MPHVACITYAGLRDGAARLSLSPDRNLPPPTSSEGTPALQGASFHLYESKASDRSEVQAILRTTRKPMTSARIDGVALKRAADRSIAGPSRQPPPRTTRMPLCPSSAGLPSWGVESKESCHRSAVHSRTLPCMSYNPYAFAGNPPVSTGPDASPNAARFESISSPQE